MFKGPVMNLICVLSAKVTMAIKEQSYQEGIIYNACRDS